MSKPFGLKDEEYWSEPWKNLAGVSWDRVDKDIAGILLDAPDRVPLDTQDSLPVLAYHSDTSLSLWRAPFKAHGVITAMRLEDDGFFAAKALPPAGPDAPKGPEPSPGFAGQEFDIDLRETLSLPWSPATLRLTAFLRDSVSNRLTVALGGSPAAYQDPAVERFLADERAKLPQRTLAFPRQVAIDAVTVPLPQEEPHLAFTSHRILVSAPGAAGKFHVSWRIPVRATDVSKDGPKAMLKGFPPVTAVAALSLLLIGSQRGELISIPLRLPAFNPVVQEDGKPIASGSFVVDLLGFESVREEPQTWFIYGFAGEILQGPATVAVVSQDSLPQGGR